MSDTQRFGDAYHDRQEEIFHSYASRTKDEWNDCAGCGTKIQSVKSIYCRDCRAQCEEARDALQEGRYGYDG